MGPKQEQSFKELKKLATKTLVLVFFCLRKPTQVEIDASYNMTTGIIF